MSLRLLPYWFFLFFFQVCYSLSLQAGISELPKKVTKITQCQVLLYKQTDDTHRMDPEKLKLCRVMDYKTTTKYKLSLRSGDHGYHMTSDECISYLSAINKFKPVQEIILGLLKFNDNDVQENINAAVKYCCSTITDPGIRKEAESTIKEELFLVLQSGQLDDQDFIQCFPDIFDKITPAYRWLQSRLKDDKRVEPKYLSFEFGELYEGIYKPCAAKVRRVLDFIQPDNQCLENLTEAASVIDNYRVTAFEISLSNDELAAVQLHQTLEKMKAQCSAYHTISLVGKFLVDVDTGTSILQGFRESGMVEGRTVLQASKEHFRYGQIPLKSGNIGHICQHQGLAAGHSVPCDLFSLLRQHPILALSMVLQVGKDTVEPSKFTARKGDFFLKPVRKECIEKMAELGRDLFPLVLPKNMELMIPSSGKQPLTRQIDRLLGQLAASLECCDDGSFGVAGELTISCFDHPEKIIMDLPFLSGECSSIDYWFFDVYKPLDGKTVPGLVIRLNPLGYGAVREDPLVMVIPLDTVKVLWSATPVVNASDKDRHAKAVVKMIGDLKIKDKSLSLRDSGYSGYSGSQDDSLDDSCGLALLAPGISGSSTGNTSLCLERTASNPYLSPSDSSNTGHGGGKRYLSPGHEIQLAGSAYDVSGSNTLPRSVGERKQGSWEMQYSASIKRSSSSRWKAPEKSLGDGKYRSDCHLNQAVTPYWREHMENRIYTFLQRVLKEHHSVMMNEGESIYLRDDSEEAIKKMLEIADIKGFKLYATAVKVLKKSRHSLTIPFNEEGKFSELTAFVVCYRHVAKNRRSMAKVLASLIPSLQKFDKIQKELKF